MFCLFVISYNYYNVYVQATSFDGVFLLVALHYIALVAIIFFIVVNKMSIYLSIYLRLTSYSGAFTKATAKLDECGVKMACL